MASYELPPCPLREIAPFALVNKFGASSARGPRPHGSSAGKDKLSSRAKISAPVQFEHGRGAAEVAMVATTGHDARSLGLRLMRDCHETDSNGMSGGGDRARRSRT